MGNFDNGFGLILLLSDISAMSLAAKPGVLSEHSQADRIEEAAKIQR